MAQIAESACSEALHCVASLAQGGDVGEAADVLRNECSDAPAAALAVARHAVLEAFVRQSRVDAAAALALECLRAPGQRQQLQVQSQDLILRALLQSQQHTKALELLRAICQAGSAVPGDHIFNSLLDAAVRARSYSEAWDILELLLTHEKKADKYFVSILTKSLESLSDKRLVRRGIGLVDRFIDQQRADVDEIVFNSLLNVLGHMGDMQKLQSTLDKMTEYAVSPSAVTFGTVVKAYGRARDIDSVLRVWNQMRTRCLGVNPVTCGCVLDACVKCGSLDKALAIFQEMRLQGLHKNTVLYATLIKGLAKIRDLQSAMNLYQEMRMEGVPCNLVTFNSLMDVCVRCSDLQAAAFFLQDMMRMGIAPDLITFSTLIKGYSHTGEVHKALALSKELQSRGLRCDEIVYNSLIDGCARTQKVTEGLMVFSEMVQSRVAPSNITFSILVKLYFQAGQLGEAFNLVEDMFPKYQCVPNRVVYSVLLRCCTQHAGPALARGAQLLVDLASKKNSKLPDQVMVSSLVAACVEHSDFDTAARVVQDFTAFGGTRRSAATVGFDSLKLLFEALGAQQEKLGLELVEHLRCKSMPTAQISALESALAEGRLHGVGWAASRAAAARSAAACKGEGMEAGAYVANGGGGHAASLFVPTFPATQAVAPPFPSYHTPPSGSFSMDAYAPGLHPSFLAPGYAHLPPYAPSPYYAHCAAAAASAAAASAAAAVYSQHLAGYADTMASGGMAMAPQFSPASPALYFATGPEGSSQPTMTGGLSPLPPSALSTSTPLSCTESVRSTASSSFVPPPVPASFLSSGSGSFQPVPQLQAPSPAPKAQAAAAALALTPLPVGPLSPSASIAATPPPAAQRHAGTSEKVAAGKENTFAHRNKENDGRGLAKKGGKSIQQSRESQQTKQLREKAAALQAVPVGRIGL